MTNVMRGAEPFYIRGNSVGCLLTHGFTGTPKEVRGIGELLAADGYTVMGVQLAGHGTRPEDMRRTRWSDWFGSVIAGYRQLRAECDQVIVVGFSMGGTLSLLLAAWERVDGVVALSTPYSLMDWRLRVLLPFQRLIPYSPKVGDHMVDKAMAAQRLHYRRIPTICLLSLFDLLPVVQWQLPNVSAPTLLINAARDFIAPPRNAQKIIDHIGALDKRMIVLGQTGHSICEDIERETVLTHVRKFIARVLAD